MKKTCVFLAALLLFSAAASAAGEPVEGKKFEFSTGFALSIQKYSYTDGYQGNLHCFSNPLSLGLLPLEGAGVRAGIAVDVGAL